MSAGTRETQSRDSQPALVPCGLCQYVHVQVPGSETLYLHEEKTDTSDKQCTMARKYSCFVRTRMTLTVFRDNSAGRLRSKHLRGHGHAFVYYTISHLAAAKTHIYLHSVRDAVFPGARWDRLRSTEGLKAMFVCQGAARPSAKRTQGTPKQDPV